MSNGTPENNGGEYEAKFLWILLFVRCGELRPE
jgi:hypothetical protein